MRNRLSLNVTDLFWTGYLSPALALAQGGGQGRHPSEAEIFIARISTLKTFLLEFVFKITLVLGKNEYSGGKSKLWRQRFVRYTTA